jgi:hypothetical protein
LRIVHSWKPPWCSALPQVRLIPWAPAGQRGQVVRLAAAHRVVQDQQPVDTGHHAALHAGHRMP